MENKWERNRVPLAERKLDCTLTKEPQNYTFHIFRDMGLLLKDRNTIFAVSKRYINII